MKKRTKLIIVLFLLLIVTAGTYIGLRAYREQSTDGRNVTLYFSDKELNLVGEKRSITPMTGKTFEEQVLDELIKGPKSPSLFSTIPKNTKVHSVKVVNGTATVDLSADFLSDYVGGSETENTRIYSVVDTLTDLININKVRFLVNGKKQKLFGHYEMDVNFERDESLIKKQ